jgi:hypothetical protein
MSAKVRIASSTRRPPSRDTRIAPRSEAKVQPSGTLTGASEILLPNRDPRFGEMSIVSDRIDKARLEEGVLLYLLSVGLVAAAIIVLFSVASLSLLDTSKEMLIGSRIEISPIEDKFMGTTVSYADSNAAPVPVQTKSSSASEANNRPFSTPVPSSSGMSREENVTEPVFKPPPEGETSAAAVETPHGSTQGPSPDETPSELGGSPMIAQPLSIAETSAAAVETLHGSTQGPFTDETHPPELSGSQEVTVQPLSIAGETSGAQHASGAAIPMLATFDKERDQLFRDFAIQGNDHANLDEGIVTLHENAPAQRVRNRRFYNRLGLHATFRYRVRRECGPIRDRALYEHCVSTFSAYRQ